MLRSRMVRPHMVRPPMDRPRMVRRCAVLLAGALGAALALGGAAPAPAAAPLDVVATTGMVADVARNVAGGHAEVAQLMGEGVDPHLYKATRSDVTRMLRADLVLYNGLLLEGKLTDALVRAASSGRLVRAVTELVDESFLLEPPEFQGLYDPHLWMDPGAWARTIDVVRDALIELDPDHADGLPRQCRGLPRGARRSSTAMPSACWRRSRPSAGC